MAKPGLYLDVLAQHVHANALAGGDVMYEGSICGSRVQPICKPLAPVSGALGRAEDGAQIGKQLTSAHLARSLDPTCPSARTLAAQATP